MGQRSTKLRKNSYDVADRDFQYEKTNRENFVKTAPPAATPPAATPPAAAPPAAAPPAPEPAVDPKLVPSWVTAELFAQLLAKTLADFVLVKSFKAYPAMRPGENYATLMLRIDIDAELKDSTVQHLSYMMKVPHDTEAMKQMMAAVNFFVTENDMYSDVIPELEEIYRQAGKEICFAPKAYRFPQDPGCANVLLENLAPRGYKNANRLEGLDREHTEFVLRKMAQFHAVSAHRVATKGPFSDVFMNGLYGDKAKEVFMPVITMMRDAFLNTFKSHQYYSALVDCFEHFLDSFESLMAYDEAAFNVLNHGDSWTNNFLFKYTGDGKLAEMLYVDFQAPKFGSPAQDLLYFMMSSVNIEIKLKYFDHFIRFYYDNLIENLQLLKYPRKLPKLRELHMQLFTNGMWAFQTMLITLPVVVLDTTEMAKFENFMMPTEDGNKFRQMIYSNKRYHAHFNEILPWLYNRGMLESCECEKATAKPAVAAPATAPAATAATAEVEAPDWVNENYFVDILQQNVEHFKQIKKFSVSSATKACDNYSSLLLNVDIDVELTDGSTQPVSYMLKVATTDEQSSILQKAFHTFNKETAMYRDILPQLEKLYRDVGVNVTFGPKAFQFPRAVGCDAVLLENLRSRGFKNADRLAGLDEEHVRCTLSKLAQLHAASACLHAASGSFPALFSRNMYSEETCAMMEQMGTRVADHFSDAMKRNEGSEEYSDKLVYYTKNAADIMIKLSHIYENEFNVLNHGDCWTNNIMYQYDDAGKLLNTYFVGFQPVKYGSPALDLYYFLISSPALDLKVEKFDYFIHFYHSQLKENLQLLKYPKSIPTLKELHVDLLKHGAFAVSTITTVMAVVLRDPTESAILDVMLSEGKTGRDMRVSLFTNDRYRRHAEVLLKWLNERGLLDFE